MIQFMCATCVILPLLIPIWAWYIWGDTSPLNRKKPPKGIKFTSISADVFHSIEESAG